MQTQCWAACRNSNSREFTLKPSTDYLEPIQPALLKALDRAAVAHLVADLVARFLCLKFIPSSHCEQLNPMRRQHYAPTPTPVPEHGMDCVRLELGRSTNRSNNARAWKVDPLFPILVQSTPRAPQIGQSITLLQKGSMPKRADQAIR